MVIFLAACGGAGSSSSSSTDIADASADIETAFTSLETAERESFATILNNSDDENVQGVLTAISNARAGGLTSAEVKSAYQDSLARMNPYNQDTQSALYVIYEDLVQELAILYSGPTN